MAEDGSCEIRSGAAMVGVGVTQDHALYLAQGGGGFADGPGHGTNPRVEDGHAVGTLDQKDAHAHPKAAAHYPDVVRNALGSRPHEPGSLKGVTGPGASIGAPRTHGGRDGG